MLICDILSARRVILYGANREAAAGLAGGHPADTGTDDRAVPDDETEYQSAYHIRERHKRNLLPHILLSAHPRVDGLHANGSCYDTG